MQIVKKVVDFIINRLHLNPSKSQLMRCATTRRLEQHVDSPITLCGAQITPVTSVRNLGVTMDSSLSFLSHGNHVVSGSFYTSSDDQVLS